MENDCPFVSNYDWCDRHRNWYRIERRAGHLDAMVLIKLACGDSFRREYNSLMDGEFHVGDMPPAVTQDKN